MPEEMVMMARRFVLRHWEVRKEEAGGGRLVRIEVPGMRRMSNWGALMKEFCDWNESVVFVDIHVFWEGEEGGVRGSC